MDAGTGELAFVIIGRNEGPRLRKCIASALKISQRVVYADSASSDGSAECARSMGALVVELDASAPLNAARGRNAGFNRVRGEYPQCRFVQFLDGDCILVPEWPATAIAFLKANPTIAIAFGRRFEAHPEVSFYNRLADEEWNTPIGLSEACGGDAMMRVDAFEEVGGFDASLMASEEPELAARLRSRGWQIWRLDAPMTEHDAAILHFSQWWRRTVRSGYGYIQAWKRTRHFAQPVNHAKLRSALIWVVGVPVGVAAGALLAQRPILLFLVPLIWAAQIMRIGLRRRDRSVEGWRKSFMLMLAKVPELIGAARGALSRSPANMIQYKLVSSDVSAGRAT